MRIPLLFISIIVLSLTACAESKVANADPGENSGQRDKPPGKKCEDAKYQLDKAVEEGQLSDLRELKRNIELYCVWRRN
ncbi:hypothetical protein [Paraglaciecola sp.]|uniref:hypothetical protein n=1 Tax=Pseudomonadati TaxID=3379134 RepID=UPI0027401041|nr:hypothetical protein [Paraglaciecola sp.]MDP5029977.1 hypothetical protein [Paraglaciecola sp.]